MPVAAPGVAAVAVLNALVYGSPLRSGYGDESRRRLIALRSGTVVQAALAEHITVGGINDVAEGGHALSGCRQAEMQAVHAKADACSHLRRQTYCKGFLILEDNLETAQAGLERKHIRRPAGFKGQGITVVVNEFQGRHKGGARKICFGVRMEGDQTLAQVELEGAAPGPLLEDNARAAIAERNTSDIYLALQKIEIALGAGKIVVQRLVIL